MKIYLIRKYIFDIANKDGFDKINKDTIVSETHIKQIFDNIYNYKLSYKEEALSIFINLHRLINILDPLKILKYKNRYQSKLKIFYSL